MRRFIAAPVSLLAPFLLLAGCGLNGTDRNDEGEEQAAAAAEDPGADSMASNDPAPGEAARTPIRDSQPRPTMQAQVVLDRQGFGPGVIDGAMGLSTRNALEAFQEANDLQRTGELDDATKQALARWNNIPATRVVTIPESWGRIAFQPVPEEPEAQAEMQRLGYGSLEEKLAERFHTTVEVLRELNPGGRPAGAPGASSATPSPSPTVTPSPTPSASPTAGATSTTATQSAPMFRAGQQIRVPNIGADKIDSGSVDDQDWLRTISALGVGTEQPKVARIVVDKSGKWLRGYDAEDRLVAAFTVSSGSERDPLPLGNWEINGVARNPEFSYNPELFWDVPDSNPQLQLPPGPNGPVGVVWIDLTKEHYGIHGTPEPETIGRAQSHGCVRLTNWDAARLAQMVDGSTKVVFQS